MEGGEAMSDLDKLPPSAEKLLVCIHEDILDSIDVPYVRRVGENEYRSVYRADRIGNTLHITHIESGERFVLEVRNAK